MKAGWQVRKFGEVCELKKGKKPALSAAPDNGNKPYLVAKFLRGAEPVEFASVSDKNSISVGQHEIIIICDGSNSGETFMGFDGILSSTMAKVAHGAELDNKFLMHFLDSLFEQFNAGKTGSAIPHLDLPALRDQNLPLPPLPEQQRIVGILDAAFEGIAHARANAEQNLQNARALFESHLQSVFTQRGEGWIEKQLGEIAAFRNGINFTKSSKGKSIKILGVKDFQNSFWTPLNNLDSVIPDGTLPDSDTLQKDDLVFVRSNGNPELIGRCLLIGEISERITHSGFTIRARLHTADVSPIYLCHFLKSSVVRRQMIDGGNGASIKSLNQNTLSHLAIPVPPLSHQAKIILQIEGINEETQRLETLYQRKLAALDELKKALLHQAFSGVL